MTYHVSFTDNISEAQRQQQEQVYQKCCAACPDRLLQVVYCRGALQLNACLAWAV